MTLTIQPRDSHLTLCSDVFRYKGEWCVLALCDCAAQMVVRRHAWLDALKRPRQCAACWRKRRNSMNTVYIGPKRSLRPDYVQRRR